MSICFVRFSWTGFEALNIAPWLSPQSGIVLTGIPNSFKKEHIQISCLHVSERDMYSASVEESAIVFCALLFQKIAVPLSNTKFPVVDRQDFRSDAQSASAYAYSPSCLRPYCNL